MIPVETLEAALPKDREETRLVALAAPESVAAEQYRVLLQRLERLGERRPLRVVAITSTARGEGRTTTAANLALTAAKDGRATVLVEADLRRPALAALFGLAPRAGLADVIGGTAEIATAVVRVGPLAVLCAGEVRDPGATARSPRAAAVIESLRAAYELVILDAPPAIAFSDGDRIAGAADGALLVVRANETPRAVVRLAVDALGDRAAGVVLNGVDADATVNGRWLFPDPAAPPRPARKAGRKAG
jgi:protein-tyrosine kinase